MDDGAKAKALAGLPSNVPSPLIFLAAAAVAAFVMSWAFAPQTNIAAFFLHRQDRWILLSGTAALAMVGFRLPIRAGFQLLRLRDVTAIALALVIVALLGHFLVLAAYDMSRDEQMASFDAAVFSAGHLVEQLPVLWRDHSTALNTLFMYPAEQRGAWISNYLPLNAGLRALVGIGGMPELAGPLMTALGAFALWGCVRRLLPEDRESPMVALLLYCGSAQIIITGMTSYAMPAHLALNLCWLWFFLKRSRVTDAAALLVGFIATGLHQPLMHPMFAAPLLFLLVLDRSWRRVAFYFIGYAAIGLFWAWWPEWMSTLVGSSAGGAVRPEGTVYLDRFVDAMRSRDPMGIPDMVANLLRFIAWQHLLLVPLMLIGIRLGRDNRIAGALTGGLILTILVMTVILPEQGHGFGYRYLHGMIGNCILLAIYGWRSLGAELGWWRAVFVRATVATMTVLLPIQAVMAHAFYAPSAQVSAGIDRINADYAVIGRNDVPYSLDLVYNRPKFNQRPVRLVREALDTAAITSICARHPSVFLIGDDFLRPMADYYGFAPPNADAPNRDMAPRLTQAGCWVRLGRR